MQKIVYVQGKYVDEINKYLESGWIVKDFKVTRGYDDTVYDTYAYFVIEKQEG